MGRGSICFRHKGHIAVFIPIKSAEKIGLVPGCDIRVLINSKDEVRVRRVGEPVTLINKQYGTKQNPTGKLIPRK